MLRLVAIASVVALANAAGHKVGLASVGVVDGESEIRAPKIGGDIKLHRATDDAVDLESLQAQVAKIKKELFTLGDADGGVAKQTATFLADAAKSFQGAAGLTANGEAVVANVVKVGKAIESSKVQTDALVAKALVDTAAQFKDVETKLSKKANDNAALLSTLKDTTATNTELEASIKRMTDATIAMEDEINTEVDAKVAKLDKSLANLQGAKRHIWSGGAKRTHQSGGWHEFQYDREEFNTAAPYFKKESNERFKILIKGLFHYSWTWMGHCHWSHRHAQLYIGGQNLNNNYHQWAQHWHTNHVDITWVTKAGSQVRLQVYACNHAWHGSNNIDSYNRVRVEYIGQVDGSCKGVACDGH